MSHTPLLDVRHLHVEYVDGLSASVALHDVSFTLEEAESLAIVGESGAGKSTLALSLLGLLPGNAGTRDSEIVFQGKDILRQPAKELAKVRGRKLAVAFQDTTAALNPLANVGQLVTEGMRIHRMARGKAATQKAVKLLEDLGVPSPVDTLRRFPHELSLGTRQRVMLAMALSAEPSLLVLDQPCASLDPTTQAQVIELLKQLRQERKLSYLVISHDLSVVRELSDRVAVMVRGQIVELGRTRDVFGHPAHPYTQALLQSLPPEQASQSIADRRLATICGEPKASSSYSLLSCPFAARCPWRDRLQRGLIRSVAPAGQNQKDASECTNFPPPLRVNTQTETEGEHLVRCHFSEASFQILARPPPISAIDNGNPLHGDES